MNTGLKFLLAMSAVDVQIITESDSVKDSLLQKFWRKNFVRMQNQQ